MVKCADANRIFRQGLAYQHGYGTDCADPQLIGARAAARALHLDGVGTGRYRGVVDAGGKGTVAEDIVGCHFLAVGVEQCQQGVFQPIQLNAIACVGLERHGEVVERAEAGQIPL